MEHLHEVACQRLDEIKTTKRSLFELKKSKRVTKKRAEVEVTIEETEETNTASQPTELVAEEI